MKDLSAIRQPNCLNTVRLFAALLVLVGHVYLLMKVDLPDWCVWLVGFFRGVPIFFVLSGFLVWHSVDSRSLWQYARNRFLRIYPELWCAVILGLLVMLPLLSDPIRWTDVAAFTLTQSTFLQFWTPDCLRSYGCGTPNGALWTICVTVQFYIAVYFMHRWLRDKKLWVWLACLVVLIAANLCTPLLGSFLPTVVYKLVMQTLIPYGWLFFLGAFLAQFSGMLLPWLKKLWLPLLLAAAAVDLLGLDWGTHYAILHCLLMTPGVIGLAYCLPMLNIKRDISYGIYVYHMIVVNAMIQLGYVKNVRYLPIVLGISCLLALLSYWLVGNIGRSKNKKKAGKLL